MTGNLTTYFPGLKSVCWMDETTKQVYLRKERVTVSNTEISGYVRRAGKETLDPLNVHVGEYDSTQELIFVGSVPKGNEDNVILAVKSSFYGCGDVVIKNITTDKVLISESENLDLKKFTDVVLIMVEYDYESIEVIYDNRSIDMCECS